MRTLFILLFLLGIALPAAAQNAYTNPARPTPKLGMTKAQVMELYGAPRHHALLDGREVWYYRVKFGAAYGRTLAPFEFSSDNVYLGEIFFDSAGRVIRYRWDGGHMKGSTI